jgi:hypothetical protein
VLAWYRDRGDVITIPAVGTVEEIAERVKAAVGK